MVFIWIHRHKHAIKDEEKCAASYFKVMAGASSEQNGVFQTSESDHKAILSWD